MTTRRNFIAGLPALPAAAALPAVVTALPPALTRDDLIRQHAEAIIELLDGSLEVKPEALNAHIHTGGAAERQGGLLVGGIASYSANDGSARYRGVGYSRIAHPNPTGRWERLRGV